MASTVCSDQQRSAVGLDVNPAFDPDAGNPHVRFDERGGETECRPQPEKPRLSSTLLTGIKCLGQNTRDLRRSSAENVVGTGIGICSYNPGSNVGDALCR